MIYTCGTFIIDSLGRILLCHITNQPYNGRTWSIPKGLPDDGESYVDAACRETLEETGIAVVPTGCISIGESPYFSKSMSGKKTLVAFVTWLDVSGDTIRCKCTSKFKNDKGKMQPEVDQFRWVPHFVAREMIHDSQVAKLDEAMSMYYGSKPKLRLIIAVEDDNGEQYEDYHKWVAASYEIYTNKSAEVIEHEWKNHVVNEMLKANITVNPNWVHTIMTDSKVKSSKLHKKILKETGFCEWIEKTYDAKKVEFATIHPVQL